MNALANLIMLECLFMKDMADASETARRSETTRRAWLKHSFRLGHLRFPVFAERKAR